MLSALLKYHQQWRRRVQMAHLLLEQPGTVLPVLQAWVVCKSFLSTTASGSFASVLLALICMWPLLSCIVQTRFSPVSFVLACVVLINSGWCRLRCVAMFDVPPPLILTSVLHFRHTAMFCTISPVSFLFFLRRNAAKLGTFL